MLGGYFLLFLLALGVHAAEEDVVELSDSDFSSLENHENSLVMFYAPWCGHCKSLKPEFAKAAGLLKTSKIPITLAKVDCTEAGKATCNKFSVSGYPTLKIFAKDEMVKEYNGPREAEGIVKYMQQNVGPASQQLLNENDHKDFLETNDVSYVLYSESSDSAIAVAFATAAKKLREKARFAHTTVKSLIEKAGGKDKIVLYRPKILHNKFEPSTLEFDGEVTVAGVADFITNNYFGLTGIRTRDNAQSFATPLVVAYYNVDYIKNPKGTHYWRNRVMKVAEKHKSFTYAISNKDDFQHELNDFGVTFAQDDKPVVLAKDEKNQKFVMKEEFNVQNFEKFLSDLENKALEPFIKSEPIPEDNSAPVKVVVGKNFDDIVTNSDKDVLIEFYAPWCGHCKKLAPIFDELGEKMAGEDVIIAKFDATANDVPPQFEVRGFPTLFWVPKDSKSSPVKYEGGRDLNDFVKYIAKHSTDGLKAYDSKGEAKPVKEEL